MPRKRTYGKKKRMYRKSKLADSKINTLVEKRIQDIAKKEDEKNLQWFYNIKTIMGTAGGGFAPGDPRTTMPALVNQYQLPVNPAPTIMDTDYRTLTQLGGNYINTMGVDGGSASIREQQRYSVSFKIKTAQAFLRFFNGNATQVKVCCALIYIPNSNSYTATQTPGVGRTDILEPNRAMVSKNNSRFTPFNGGIFAKQLINDVDYGNVKYQILDRKTITLNAPRATGLVVENSREYKDIKLSHTWKNFKKLSYNCPDTGQTRNQPLSDGNIYLTISHDQEPRTAPGASSGIYSYGLAGCKFVTTNATKPVIDTSTT